MLKGTLLSYNSGCQVSERRLWDCASSSLGLLNWLCYCRPVQGEGSERESGLWYIRYKAFDCDPPPRGRVFTAALSGERDLALHPSLCFSQWTTPSTSSPTPLVRSFLGGHFQHHHGVFSSSPLFSAPIRLAQQGVANSPCSSNFHTFPDWDASIISAPLWHHRPSHYTHMHIRDDFPHRLDPTLPGLLAQRKTRVAYVTFKTE